jgi:WD40-like Beta Propeller Repeat
MSKLKIIVSVLLVAVIIVLVFFFVINPKAESGISITYPFNNALFPPEFPSPTFEWLSEVKDTSSWQVTLNTGNKFSVSSRTKKNNWKATEAEWENIKKVSDFGKIYFTVWKSGQNRKTERIFFRISKDKVGAPILYRQMPIPFVLAERRLDSMNFMLIDPGSKKPPHAAMKGFMVCGNCHSFSADGNTIGLDLDAGLRDKGGYFISPIKDTILFNLKNFRSWSKIEKRKTFGLFSKLSPNGRYVVTTVKDRVVMKNFPFQAVEHLAYSQLFFPVNGHLAVYDRETGILKELPGADLDQYVQTNAAWTPDGKSIVFSRGNALPMGSDPYEINVQDDKLIDQYVDRIKTLKYNICIIPFNNGEGGKAEPIAGASGNGKSNYFPAVSPDGKWLIFCQAETFMLLMPDSRLYIVPVTGGKARPLQCNFNAMNSWHSWSPNSKWLVYSSKGLGPYTDMFLTHIDESGNASIPVLVEKARVDYKVSNYPEFVNRRPEDTFVMDYDYVELTHIKIALKNGDKEKAKQLFHKLENQEPFLFSEDCTELSNYLNAMGLASEAKKYAERAKHTINSTIFNTQ